MIGVALAPIAEFERSVAKYPNIKTGEEFTGYGKAKGEPVGDGARGAAAGAIRKGGDIP